MNKLLLYCFLFFSATSFPACFEPSDGSLSELNESSDNSGASAPSAEESDDIPFQAPLYFTTHNSVRYVSFSKRTVTVGYGEDWNLFGLTSFQYDLISTDHERGMQKYSLQYSPYGRADQSLLFPELEKATDHQYGGAGEVFIAANYNIYKSSDNNPTPYPEASLVKAPFTLAVRGNFLWVAGENELSITNIRNNRSKLIQDHGIVMAGYGCFDENGAFYVTDTATDAVKKLSAAQVIAAEQAVDPEQTTLSFPFETLSEGNMLMDPNQSEKRGPVGIDFAKGRLWVTVDAGTKLPGKLVIIDPNDGTQKLYLDGLPGPRAVVVTDN